MYSVISKFLHRVIINVRADQKEQQQRQEKNGFVFSLLRFDSWFSTKRTESGDHRSVATITNSLFITYRQQTRDFCSIPCELVTNNLGKGTRSFLTLYSTISKACYHEYNDHEENVPFEAFTI